MIVAIDTPIHTPELNDDQDRLRQLLATLGDDVQGNPAIRTEPFTAGLYGCSELFVEGMLDLYRAGILKREGYISDFAVEGQLPKAIKMKLKYQGKKSVIEGLRRVSTPGLRRYVGSTAIPRVRGGLGVAVLSTSEGIMTGNQARKKNLGGELLCYVW